MTRRLLVVQPYLAQYRVPFWEGVTSQLERAGIELQLGIGMPEGSQAARGDAALWAGSRSLPTHAASLLGRKLRWQSSWVGARSYDAIVVEASGSLLDTTVHLLRRQTRVGLWGHITPHTKRASGIDAALEAWQLKRADHVFAYTPVGADYALQLRGEKAGVTTLHNTIDVSDLTRSRASMTVDDAARELDVEISAKYSYLCYVGGLDSDKRVEFLARSWDRISLADPRARLLVGGQGDQASLLASSGRPGSVVMLGFVRDDRKAALGVLSSAIMMPGRVGLIAVEARAMGLPIVTTNWPYHAPEFAYLTDGFDCVICPDSIEDYADRVLDLISPRGADELSRLRANSLSLAGKPELEVMKKNFVAGALTLLNISTDGSGGVR